MICAVLSNDPARRPQLLERFLALPRGLALGEFASVEALVESQGRVLVSMLLCCAALGGCQRPWHAYRRLREALWAEQVVPGFRIWVCMGGGMGFLGMQRGAGFWNWVQGQ